MAVMLGFGGKGPVAEYEARGEIERVYHEIRQVLRVTGVNLNFRTWAQYGDFLPLMWDAMRPNAETLVFEEAADQVRAEAAHAAERLGPFAAAAGASLGESQIYQIRSALDLYHYVNPKLLVLTSAVALSLEGETIGEARDDVDRVVRGAPLKMYPMEMESDSPDDQRLQALYADIKETLDLPSVNSDYRTMALWPDYLAAAWGVLKPVVQSDAFRAAADALRETSRQVARQLPLPIGLTRQRVEGVGQDPAAIVEVTEKFEQLLPGLIVNVALCESEWLQGDSLRRSPFPAEKRPSDKRGAA